MKQAELPVELDSGEMLLRWSTPNWADRFAIVTRRARVWVILSVLINMVPLLLCMGLARALSGSMGTAVFIIGGPSIVLFATLVPLLVVARTSSPPKWWVTTRRLVLRGRKGPEELPLTAFESLSIDGPYQTTVVFGGVSHTLKNVVGAPGLWGSLLMGKALSAVDFPTVEADRPEPNVTGMVAWTANGTRGSAQASGILVFFPNSIAWIPGTTTDLGDRMSSAAAALAGRFVGLRVTTVRPEIPFDPLFYRLMRLEDPSQFRSAIEDVIDAWGGFVRLGAEGVSVNKALRGENVTLQVNDTTYKAIGIKHPEWPSMKQSLGL